MPAVGLGISIYLWQAKLGLTTLVCTGFSDCVGVNSSEYSHVAGIPVAALGSLLYGVLLAAAIVRRQVPRWRSAATTLAGTAAIAGALFSLYLTGIEAFVLRAYCIWCLVSWVIITALAWVWISTMRREGVVDSSAG